MGGIREHLLCACAHSKPDGSCSSANEAWRKPNCALWDPRPRPHPSEFPEGGADPAAPLSEQRAEMLLLWVSVVATSALAAPVPGAGGLRQGAVQAWPDAPNVVLVVSDSFVSTERQGRGCHATLPPPAHSPSCAAGFGEQNLRLSNKLYTPMQSKKRFEAPYTKYVHHINMHITVNKTHSD